MTPKQKSYCVRNGEPGEPIVEPDPWYLGYASALAQIWRLHHDCQMIRHLLSAGGLSIKHLQDGGVDELDMGSIHAAMGAR